MTSWSNRSLSMDATLPPWLRTPNLISRPTSPRSIAKVMRQSRSVPAAASTVARFAPR